MQIAVLKERKEGERRVAASPDSVKKFIQLGWEVVIEAGAGNGSSIRDGDFESAGAKIAADAAGAARSAAIILKVNSPEMAELEVMPSGSVLVGSLSPYDNAAGIQQYAQRNITAFAMELMPRISRAQSMDVLSSQSNLAGYRAVIDAAATFGKALPMMMTAAGTVAPAKALILGAGVAGLQAIATAKRLGAVVSAFDVRPAVKEQVESLGAKFIEVPSEEKGEAAGGYAKEMSEDYKRKQAALIHETLKKQDLVITTALIPGKPAPVLIPEFMVADMKSGSVIVDLAVNAGGNCPLARPDQMVTTPNGVTIIGYSNIPSRVAVDASPLYARNLYNFVSTALVNKSELAIQWEDELVRGTLLTRDGAVVHPLFAKGA